jgi:hypothetical protein
MSSGALVLPPPPLLRWMDVLVWVEGTIYQVDEDNEHLSKQGSVSADLGFTGALRWPQPGWGHLGASLPRTGAGLAVRSTR